MTDHQSLTEAFAFERLGTGEYAFELGGRWVLPYGAVFGGAMMAAPLTALGDHTGGRNLLAASCHFLRAGRTGSSIAVVDDVKEGRTTSTHRVSLHQDNRVVVTLLATVGPEAHGKPVFADPPPPLPDRGDCHDPRAGAGDLRPEWDQFVDVLADGDAVERAFAGEPLEEPDVRAWVRLRDNEFLDGARLALLADDWPPAPWLLGRWGIMRTIELNLHLFHSGHQGWAIGHVRTKALFDDLFTVSGTLWTEDGVPLAEWRQVALFEEIAS